jgi:hypothetical protein
MYAVGVGGQKAGQKQALKSVMDLPLGGVILGVIAVGLLLYFVWRIIEAAVDPEGKGKDAKGVAHRFGYVVSGLVYGALGIYSASIVIRSIGGGGGSGSGSGGGGGGAQSVASKLLSQQGGQFLVGAVAVILFAVGIGQAVIAWKAKFMEGEKKSEMSQKEIKTVRSFGRWGYASRGVVSVIIGYFFMRAAVTANPGQARGTEGAFSFLQSTTYGPVLLAIVALGLLSYGIFIYISVKYKRMNI